jgi:hypothetical protein
MKVVILRDKRVYDFSGEVCRSYMSNIAPTLDENLHKSIKPLPCDGQVFLLPLFQNVSLSRETDRQ